MKKSYITLAAIILCIGYGVLSWDIATHSQEPEPSKYAQACKDEVGTSNACCIDYNGALDAANKDWQNSLQNLIDQEKPASEMVGEGYESLRTYNCWLEYICRAVEFSGHAPIESAYGTGLRSEHLGTVPGCQAPEDLRMESEYNLLIQTFKEIPVVGVAADTIDKAFVDNKINYFPRCMTGSNDNEFPNVVQARSNYSGCKIALEKQFGCPAEVAEANDGICPETSNAFVTLENVLKKSHADQKASAMERKLATIVTKLSVMEEHVGYLQGFLNKLDSRFSCYAAKCD